MKLNFTLFIEIFISNCFAGWRVRCAEYFPYSTYFKGQKSSAVSGSVNSDICSKAENGDFHKNQAEDLISVNGDSLDLKGLRITSPDKPDQIC